MTTLLSRPQQARPAPSAHGGRPVRRGSANLPVGAATAAAVLLSSLSIHGVIEGWSWLPPLFLAVVLPLAATAGIRRLGWPLPLVPLAGIAALVLTLTWLFAASSAVLGFLPGPAAFARADALLLEARTVIITEVTPVQPLAGIVFLCCAGVGLVAVLADTLAATLRMPATAGLGLFAVVMIPAVLKPESIGPWYFLLAAAGYLLLLAAGSRREQQAPGVPMPRAWAGRSAAVSASALLLSLLLPAVLPGFTGGAFPEGSKFNFWSNTTGLNPIVTLGNDLRQPQSAGRITYATSSQEPVYLRSTTLEDFSGRRWSPDLRTDERRQGIAAMAAGTTGYSSPEGTPGTPVVTRISSKTYASPWLLAPYYPLGISGADGSWSWDPKTMTVLDDGSDSSGAQDYQVLSVSAQLTPEQLAAVPAADTSEVDPVFTDLPEDLPARIGEAARDAVGDASSPYTKAMAIQSYLRGPQFSYSLDAPVEGGYDGNGMDVLSEFLDRKAGYCIHFAAAMTVMARYEGIPSRMALGYAPGQSTGETPDGTGPNGEALTEFEVDSTDAHAWPELYFEGAGWVRFEPTPSRGSVPDYAQQARPATGASVREDEDPRVPGAQPAVPSVPREDPLEPETVLEPDASQGTAWTGGVLAALAAAAAALAPWALRRRRTAKRKTSGSRSGPAWDEIADLGLDYGYPGHPSDTPRAYARRLSDEAGFAPPADAALTRICRAYEEEAYARADSGVRPGGGTVSARPAADWADVDSVRAALHANARLFTRLHARFLPPSLTTRFRHG
ncbi:transglutaminase TgpA family protein [Arthrobacter sp. zg-Y750]|uniref:transglutaminase TgpA family protein n=1 Tax=Arthrobacter sp. zg-Y750 TaxID=2894189 RepID=UPI001E341840|nr:DUF3488 and transglutaminase-like domain-containing protein [Arthrobacter sp. zg-Y750]MCC9179045.1 DUF3488 and transglutaminase-like domain-containing protein [Arthrobacter sp. zg-Y750]